MLQDPFQLMNFPHTIRSVPAAANRHSVIILKEAMANLVDIQLIKQGVETWNRMRRENPGQRPDLSGILLGGANLCEADLHRTKLSGTYLKEADLSGAFLLEADLSETYLNEANLSGANLGGANLTGASLRRANPSGANLRMTNLVRADLAYANLEGIRNWEKNRSMELVNIRRLLDPPDGFREWAKRHGAVFLRYRQWKKLMERTALE